jgi:hypothetical protein
MAGLRAKFLWGVLLLRFQLAAEQPGMCQAPAGAGRAPSVNGPVSGHTAALGQPVQVAPEETAAAPAALAVNGGEADVGFRLNLTPPGPGELFRFDSEERMRARFRAGLQGFPNVEFPPTGAAVPAPLPTLRTWPSLVATPEPAYVCHKRLWFEQKNSERYGWELSILQPFIATGVFYTDVALLPLHWLTDPCRCFDCSAGQCLPGDPVPLLWNPVFGK